MAILHNRDHHNQRTYRSSIAPTAHRVHLIPRQFNSSDGRTLHYAARGLALHICTISKDVANCKSPVIRPLSAYGSNFALQPRHHAMGRHGDYRHMGNDSDWSGRIYCRHMDAFIFVVLWACCHGMTSDYVTKSLQTRRQDDSSTKTSIFPLSGALDGEAVALRLRQVYMRSSP